MAFFLHRGLRRGFLVAILTLSGCEPRPRPASDSLSGEGLLWEKETQSAEAEPTDLSTDFEFIMTNNTGKRLEILGNVLPTDVEVLDSAYPESGWVSKGAQWGIRVRVHHWKPGINERPFFVKTSMGTSRLIASVTVPPGNQGIEWESRKLQGAPEDGENLVFFTFRLKNTTDADVKVLKIDTSCGCTTGRWPRDPWILAPGERSEFDVELSRFGREGAVAKEVYFKTELGITQLSVTGLLPDAPMNADARSQNQLLAQADPTAIFHDGCASCHVTPGIGLEGMPLYDAVCGICHDSEHRAEMVPSLTDKIGTADQGYWRHWITKGRDGSLMPGFSDSVDGPLTASQIESLVGALSKE